MTITHVTEREMKLANMLQMTNAVLDLVRAERDELRAQLQAINQPPVLDSHNQSNEPVS